MATAQPLCFHEALFTDLYELTMAQAYHAEAMDQAAVFELFFRKMPETRNYLMAAGLDDVLSFLENVRLSEEDLDYLSNQPQFSDSFLQHLKGFRFTGDVYAVAEGTLVFANEPLIQIVAPILQAQLLETLVINQLHFQSLAATKAARLVTAAEGRKVVDFGSRRAHGTDAALKVARSSYLAGAAGTSNVLAGKLYGIPLVGTMAHSYVQAHASEQEAFEAFTRIFPETTLLVDTYDTLEGVRQVIQLSRRLGQQFRVRAIRLDSGDLGQLAQQSRKLLDEAGLQRVQIFASSGLDEYALQALVRSGAPIDAFGVGTKLAVSEDVPYLDFAYKLVEYAGQPRTKLSADKVIYPGRKQIFRVVEQGQMVRDVMGRPDDPPLGTALLQQVMQGGQRTDAGRVSLQQARQHAQRQLQLLPEPLHSLKRAGSAYPIQLSPALQRDAESLRRRLLGRRH